MIGASAPFLENEMQLTNKLLLGGRYKYSQLKDKALELYLLDSLDMPYPLGFTVSEGGQELFEIKVSIEDFNNNFELIKEVL